MQRYFVFDFDGVITDGIPLQDEAYVLLFSKYGLDVSVDYLHTHIGMTSRQVIEKIAIENSIDESLDSLVQAQKALVKDLYATKAEPAPGLRAFVTKLQESNFTIAVASSTQSDILKLVLSKFGILDAFVSVVGGEMISKGKPDPEMIQKSLDNMGASPANAVAIDDARSGILAANTLGMYSIGYMHYAKTVIPEANVLVNDFAELDLSKL